MTDLEKLIDDIYVDIFEKNSLLNIGAVPASDKFFEYLAKKYNLIPFAIPKLIKILIDSHRIFSMVIIEADRLDRTRRVEGFIVTKGALIKSLIKSYDLELIRLYSIEYNKKISAERIVKELSPLINKFNNTPFGEMLNVSINLRYLQLVLENSIMKYGQSWQNKQMQIEIENSDPISFFIKEDDKKDEPVEQKSTPIKKKRAVDSAQYPDFKSSIDKHSIEKTLVLYGIEFYTRVCFREYKFDLMLKLLEEGVISKKDDLKVVKKFLQKQRVNSDKDTTLQKYALEINELEKYLNYKLKQR